VYIINPTGKSDSRVWGRPQAGAQMIRRYLPLLLLAAIPAAQAQSRSMNQGPHRMEIMLERFDLGTWHVIDPGLVLASGDRVRFRFRTNFDGYLYVTNQSSSGNLRAVVPPPGDRAGESHHQQQGIPGAGYLGGFPRRRPRRFMRWCTGWSLPRVLSEAPPRIEPVAARLQNHHAAGADSALRRCHPEISGRLHRSFGGPPRWSPRGCRIASKPGGCRGARPLAIYCSCVKNDKAVISSPVPLTGPVIYEYRLAHR